MPPAKADGTKERNEKKRKIFDDLTKALADVNKAESADDVDGAVAKAEQAETTALTLTTEAINKAIAPKHTSDDEDVEVELRDFLTKAQTAAQKVREAGQKMKDAHNW